jgi:hypothetical protein
MEFPNRVPLPLARLMSTAQMSAVTQHHVNFVRTGRLCKRLYKTPLE